MKEEMEKDNHVGEPQRKRIKGKFESVTPDDSLPVSKSGRGRGRKVAKKDAAEPSEDVDSVTEVKKETGKPLKKKKKEEVGSDFESYWMELE